MPASDAQAVASVPALSSTSDGLGEIERKEKVAFFDRLEKTSNLDERAFLLRIAGFKPYDERTRTLVMSVADEGPVGAVVQQLLHTPQPMPASILKPVRLPRPPKLKRVRPLKSLYETLLGKDDEAA